MGSLPFSSFSLIEGVRDATRRHPLACAATVLLAWTIVLRLPFAGIVDDDEVFFSLVAARWTAGELPYAASFDVKPPLLFLLYAIANGLAGGASLAAVKGLEIVVVAWGAWALYRLLSRHGTRLAAMWAAGLYPVFSLAFSGVSSPNILLQMPFIILAFDLVLTRENMIGNAGFAGVLIGCAGLIKQTAIFEACAILAVLAIWTPSPLRLKALCAYAFGAVGPWGLAGLYFMSRGAGDAAIHDVMLSAFQRLGAAEGGPQTPGLIDGIIRFLPQMKPALVPLALSVLAALRLREHAKDAQAPLVAVALVWTAAAAFGMMAMRSLYDFYSLALVAPLLLASGTVLASWVRFQDKQRAGAILAFAVAAIVVAAWFSKGSLWLDPVKGRNDPVAVTAAASRLKALGAGKDGAILVVNRGLGIHLETGILPSSRVFHPLHVMCDFPTGTVDPVRGALSRKPEFVVVADTRIRMACETQTRHDALNRSLTRDYVNMGTTAGTWDRFTIYRIKPEITRMP